MRTRRIFLPLMIAAAVAATACSRVPVRPSDPATGPAASAPAPQGVTTIKLMQWSNDPWIDAVISAFHAKYPNYRVEYVPLAKGADKRQTVQTMASANDVDVMPLLDALGMTAGDLLLDLEPFINKAHFDLNALAINTDQMRINGKLYDLPYAMTPPVLVYNKAMFQAAGLPLPGPGWTWDDFRTAASRLGRNGVWGYSADRLPDLVDAWIVEKSGNYGDQADDASLRQWLQFWSTLINTDKTVQPFSQGDPRLFTEGKAAMTSLRLRDLLRMDKPVGSSFEVAPLPSMPGVQSAGPAFIDTMGISTKSKNPDAAFAFLSFLCGPEGAKIIAGSGALPVYNTPETKQAFLGRRPAPPAGTEALFQTKWTIPPRTSGAGNQALWQAIDDAMMRVMDGQASGDQAADDLIRQLPQLRANAGH